MWTFPDEANAGWNDAGWSGDGWTGPACKGAGMQKGMGSKGSGWKCAGMPPAFFDTMPEDQLVATVKDMQKSDPVGKEQWIAYVDARCGGMRDPAKHGTDVLRDFLKGFASGNRLDTEAEIAQLPQVTKILQKRSGPFKDAWVAYCQAWGNGRNDPLRHEPTFHMHFFTELAQNALSTGMGGMTGMGMSSGPYAKRARDDSWAAWGTGTGDLVKDDLVSRIKAFQRRGDEQKQAWWSFCDTSLGGVRDPSRHDNMVLQQFCDQYCIEPTGPPQAASQAFSNNAGWMGADPAFANYGGGAAAAPMDPMKAHLVQRIKNYQKRGAAEKANWYSLCGKDLDPARHDVEKLQEFVQILGA
eukprot:CAMPEP_0117523472 /NCGR_PEP_ID=MMETSP0784-20121206/34745_1 /TAXON_ID=39447 /ORGANISM="" /LENGTH=355 /DNA_ID=CAMNT_0005319585 /DNA_START=49 /DNA_END=1116 /DNA_ORIENTATION=-